MAEAFDQAAAQPVERPQDPAARIPLLRTEGLTIKFRTEKEELTAAHDVSLTVGTGEVAGLVGESGCGKSVCALSVMRLLPPPPTCRVSGRIFFGPQELTALDDRQIRSLRGRKISMVFQEPLTALNPVFTVGEQIAEVYRAHHRARRTEARSAAQEMLARVGLSDPNRRARQYPHELSGGMRQRVLIAMALACKPELLIADEPTTALDVTVQAQILDLLVELKEELGLSVLFITHDLAVVAHLCSSVTVLYAGRVVEAGQTRQVFGSALHPYTAGLLQSLPENAIRPGKMRPRLKQLAGSLPSFGSLPTGCVFEPRCPRADSACRQSEPELSQPPERADRKVRCYHPLED